MAKLSEILLNNATGTNSVVLIRKQQMIEYYPDPRQSLRLTSLMLLGVVIFIIV